MAACILIPAYNAAATVKAVIMEAISSGFAVAVVDDGSTDATGRIAAGYPVTLLSHETNRGKGAALKTGFRWALAEGFKHVITVDADGQHDLSACGRLVEAAVATAADIMIGSRFEQFEEMAGLRKFWNRFGVWCMRRRTGFEISDSQSGFRCYSDRLLRSVSSRATGYDLEMELLMLAWKQGFRVASLSVPARVADGRPTSHFRPVRDTWSICKVFLRNM